VAVAVADLLRAVTGACLGEAVATALVQLELAVVAAAEARLRLVGRCQSHDKIYGALENKGHQIV
jgi:hypothetical protein